MKSIVKSIVTTGKIEGRRERGRQGEKMLDSLIAWHGLKSTEDMFRCMADRELSRDIIVFAVRHNTK
jgi:hypothetical protein